MGFDHRFPALRMQMILTVILAIQEKSTDVHFAAHRSLCRLNWKCKWEITQGRSLTFVWCVQRHLLIPQRTQGRNAIFVFIAPRASPGQKPFNYTPGFTLEKRTIIVPNVLIILYIKQAACPCESSYWRETLSLWSMWEVLCSEW